MVAGHILKVLIVDDDDADTLMIEDALQADVDPPEIAAAPVVAVAIDHQRGDQVCHRGPEDGPVDDDDSPL